MARTTVTKATSDRHKRRAEDLELVVQQLAEDHDRTQAALIAERDMAGAAATASEDLARQYAAELDGLDPEARLLADLEAAVERFAGRLAARDEERARLSRATGGYGMTAGYAFHTSVEARPATTYRPALESPLGRALLHVAARHGVQLEAAEVELPEVVAECHGCGRPR
jgi:hypothetical protein